MDGECFDEESLFAAIDRSGARALVIGRRGLIILGAPVMTSDYDFWIHIDDIEKFNLALEPLDFHPNFPPDEVRKRGRYVLEGETHVDVMVARAQSTKDDATRLSFDDAWARRQTVRVGSAPVNLPCIADYILTKRWALRTRDIQDVVYLETIRTMGGRPGTTGGES